MRAHDPRIREKHIQPAVSADGIVHHPLDLRLLGRIHLHDMDVGGRVEGRELALVRRQMAVVVVADVDGTGAVGGELVRRGTADAQRGVAPGYDDYFSACSTVGAARRAIVLVKIDLFFFLVMGERKGGNAYGPTEGPATVRIVGMSSKVEGWEGVRVRCAAMAPRRAWGGVAGMAFCSLCLFN
jgi:hypothetical protein